MAKTKTEPMVEHRVTVVVRYPLAGAVPSLAHTVQVLTDDVPGQQGYDFDVVAQSAKTVRVPVSENGAGK